MICPLLALLASVPVALGQCPPQWLSGPDQGVPGVEGGVLTSIEWDPDGPGPKAPALVVGGGLTLAGNQQVSNIAMWDGASWQALGPGLNGTVHDLAVHDGHLIATGDFTASGTVALNHVARWDGAGWQPMGAGVARGYALAKYNGDLIATDWDGSANRLTRWTGSSWQPFAARFSNLVWAMTVYNGDLIAAGYFTQIDGVTVNRIARWDGAAWHPLGIGTNDAVRALAVHNGELMAGGDFGTAGGISAMHIARWNGADWQAVGPGVNYSVYCLVVYQGELVAGVTSAVARWNGGSWSWMGGAMTSNNQQFVGSLSLYKGDLIVGGFFTHAGGVGARSVARWDRSGWLPIGPGLSRAIRAFVEHNGQLYAGGEFGLPSPDGPAHVARRVGDAWEPMAAGMVPHWREVNQVNALAVYRGELIAGGEFATAGPTVGHHVARWDGSSWRALGTGLDEYGWVSALAVHGGELVVAGYFKRAGEAVAESIARWDGTTWRTMGGTRNRVNALLVHNGILFAGGKFNIANRYDDAVMRWTGSAWTILPAGLRSDDDGVPPEVYTMTSYGDELVVGGNFDRAGGVPVPGLAAWNGTTWRGLGSSVAGATSFVVRGGQLIAGTTRISRWDGTVWHHLGTADGPVMALTAHEGRILAGGWFNTVNGMASSGWARYGAVCNADFNCDGFVDGADYGQFVAAFDSGAAAADINGDAFLDGLDYDLFMRAFEAGC